MAASGCAPRDEMQRMEVKALLIPVALHTTRKASSGIAFALLLVKVMRLLAGKLDQPWASCMAKPVSGTP